MASFLTCRVLDFAIRRPALVVSQMRIVSTLVWVPEWELRCCGAPFKVGDQVEWGVGDRLNDGRWLAELLGEPLAPDGPLRYYAQHVVEEDLQGTVVAIDAVWAARTLPGSDEDGLGFVPGSAQKRHDHVAEVNGLPSPSGSFIGYLVQLKL